jgi:hypothetical protein
MLASPTLHHSVSNPNLMLGLARRGSLETVRESEGERSARSSAMRLSSAYRPDMRRRSVSADAVLRIPTGSMELEGLDALWGMPRNSARKSQFHTRAGSLSGPLSPLKSSAHGPSETRGQSPGRHIRHPSTDSVRKSGGTGLSSFVESTQPPLSTMPSPPPIARKSSGALPERRPSLASRLASWTLGGGDKISRMPLAGRLSSWTAGGGDKIARAQIGDRNSSWTIGGGDKLVITDSFPPLSELPPLPPLPSFPPLPPLPSEAPAMMDIQEMPLPPIPHARDFPPLPKIPTKEEEEAERKDSLGSFYSGTGTHRSKSVGSSHARKPSLASSESWRSLMANGQRKASGDTNATTVTPLMSRSSSVKEHRLSTGLLYAGGTGSNVQTPMVAPMMPPRKYDAGMKPPGWYRTGYFAG